MIPYFILLLVISLLSFFLQKFKRSRYIYKFLGVILILILTFFAGLRDSSVGTDTNNYIWSFIEHSKENLNIESSVEIGYITLEKGAALFTNEYWFLLSLIAFIVVYFYYITIIRLSMNYYISFFLFVTLGTYLFFFNGARQGLAAAIYSFAVINLIKKNFKKYIFWVSIASLFHKTVLITIPLYFLFQINFSIKNLFIISAISTISILSLFKILSFLPESMVFRYKIYENRGATGGELLTLFYTINTLLLFSLRSVISKRYIYKYDIFLNMIFFHTLIYIIVVAFKLDVNFIRLSLYFSLGFILIWSIVFKVIKNNLKLVLFIFFTLEHLFFYYFYIEKMANLMPYKLNTNLF